MSKALLLAVALAAGCGTGDGAPAMETSPIVGNWISTADSCATYFDATATEFVIGEVCAPASGPLQASAIKGTYTLAGTAFTSANMESTCRDTPRAFGEKITVSGDSLVMSDSTGIVAFVRNTAAAGSAVLTYGCFANGVFTASPLAPL